MDFKIQAAIIILSVFGVLLIIALIFSILAFSKRNNKMIDNELKIQNNIIVRTVSGMEIPSIGNTFGGVNLVEGDLVLKLRDEQTFYKFSNQKFIPQNIYVVEGSIITISDDMNLDVEFIVVRLISNLNILTHMKNKMIVPNFSQDIQTFFYQKLNKELNKEDALFKYLENRQPILASSTTNGLISSNDKLKLDGLAEFATRVETAQDLKLSPFVDTSVAELLSHLKESLTLQKTFTRNPNPDDDISLGFEVGNIWINITDQKYYICISSAKNAALWKVSTFQNQTKIWQIQKTLPFGGSIDSCYNGWHRRKLNDFMLVDSGPEVKFTDFTEDHISISNIEEIPVKYFISAKAAARDIGLTEIRWVKTSLTTTPDVVLIQSTIVNSNDGNQVYPELLGLIEIPAESTETFILEQYSNQNLEKVFAGLGFAGSSSISMYVDIIITTA